MTERFEPGLTYVLRVTDGLIPVAYTVTRRVGKKTVEMQGGQKYRAVEVDGVERIFPDGRYSMCPVLAADRPIQQGHAGDLGGLVFQD